MVISCAEFPAGILLPLSDLTSGARAIEQLILGLSGGMIQDIPQSFLGIQRWRKDTLPPSCTVPWLLGT